MTMDPRERYRNGPDRPGHCHEFNLAFGWRSRRRRMGLRLVYRENVAVGWVRRVMDDPWYGVLRQHVPTGLETIDDRNRPR